MSEFMQLSEKVERLTRRLELLDGKNNAFIQLADRMRINQNFDVAGNLAITNQLSAGNISATGNIATSTGSLDVGWSSGGNIVHRGYQDLAYGATDPGDPTSGRARVWQKYGQPLYNHNMWGRAVTRPYVDADSMLDVLPWGNWWHMIVNKPGVGPYAISQTGSGCDLGTAGTVGCEHGAQPGATSEIFRPIVTYNGTTSYLVRTAATDLLVANAFNVFGGWYYLSSVGRNHGLMCCGITTPTFNLHINSSNQIICSAWNSTQNPTVTSSVAATTGWHFIAGHIQWYNSSSYEVAIIVDGTRNAYSGAALTSTFRAPVGNFRIGNDFNNYFLSGYTGPQFVSYSGGNFQAVEDYYACSKPYYQ